VGNLPRPFLEPSSLGSIRRESSARGDPIAPCAKLRSPLRRLSGRANARTRSRRKKIDSDEEKEVDRGDEGH
jgi:hypothetical protein